MSKLKNYFGIDFGTTSSATVGFSIMGDEINKILYSDDEGRPLPSVVAIDKTTGEVFTGRNAWEKRMELSETCEYIASVKTLLSDDEWKCEAGGQIWTSVDVAAKVFASLKDSVKERSGLDMNEACVAMPVGFSAEKRKKLRKAAEMAGIKITSMVSEPTAAFFANYNDLRDSSIVTVFDWGGGTLDVSVIEHKNGKVSELATNGMNIAGDDIDRKLAQKIHTRIARKKGIKLNFEDMPSICQDMLLVRSERAKRALSDDDDANVSINKYGEFGAFRETVDYDWFAEIVEPEVNKAVECLRKTIRESGVNKANIDRILMVGGSSNLRPLVDKLEAEFGDKLYFPDETMWNVGEGAGKLAENPGNYYSNQYIGIKLSDGSVFNLLEPGQKLENWKIKYNFGIVDSSEEARFVFAGSSDIENGSYKYNTLSIPAYRFLQEQITVEAYVDENLIFSAEAHSNMRTEEFGRFWDYTQLKCYYKLPDYKGGEK